MARMNRRHNPSAPAGEYLEPANLQDPPLAEMQWVEEPSAVNSARAVPAFILNLPEEEPGYEYGRRNSRRRRIRRRPVLHCGASECRCLRAAPLLDRQGFARIGYRAGRDHAG